MRIYKNKYRKEKDDSILIIDHEKFLVMKFLLKEGKIYSIRFIDLSYNFITKIETEYQEIELFEDMISITLPDNRTDDELDKKVEELNNKINEKYGIENKVEDIEIIHNPKIKLTSIIMPYALTLGIGMAIILVYVAIRYRKLGTIKTVFKYILTIIGSEMLLLSLIAITRYPVNRIVVPLGLILLLVQITVLGFKNEKALSKIVAEQNK